MMETDVCAAQQFHHRIFDSVTISRSVTIGGSKLCLGVYARTVPGLFLMLESPFSGSAICG